MLTKIAGILFLSAWHGFLSGARRAFAENRNQRPERFWRMTNELPFLAAIVIVLAVTTKFGR
jgi:putative membrane protein